MTHLINSVRTRRDLLVGLGATGLGLASGRVLANDRPMISTGRNTVCDNSGVMVSDMSDRIATVSDFAGSATCRLSRGTTEGPYFICTGTMNARNIAEDLEGVPMTLAIRVVDQTCTPIASAIVDAWHCDARGNYSGHAVNPDSPARVSRGMPRVPDIGSRFLRGVLATDAEGIAEFDAIYPGYYGRRAIHTHYKVHIGNAVYLTSQALYPEDWNERIVANPLYSEGRRGKRPLNANDWISRNGDQFTVSERGGRLLATINLSVRT